MSVSVVIPCYSSPKSLANQVSELTRLFSNSSQFEVILVCDACPGNSWSLIKQIAQENLKVRGYLLGRNVGQSAATFFGLKMARGNLRITMDDDGQHTIDAVKRIVAEDCDGFDVVYGVPRNSYNGNIRRLLSNSFRHMLGAFGFFPDIRRISSLRAIKSNVLNTLFHYSSMSSDIDWFISQRTERIHFVEVTLAERLEGKSNYSFIKLVRHALRLVSSSSEKLLTITSYLGVLALFISTSVGLVTLASYSLGQIKVAGYTSIVILLTFLFSITITILGVIGRQLAILGRNTGAIELTWVRDTINVIN